MHLLIKPHSTSIHAPSLTHISDSYMPAKHRDKGKYLYTWQANFLWLEECCCRKQCTGTINTPRRKRIPLRGKLKGAIGQAIYRLYWLIGWLTALYLTVVSASCLTRLLFSARTQSGDAFSTMCIRGEVVDDTFFYLFYDNFGYDIFTLWILDRGKSLGNVTDLSCAFTAVSHQHTCDIWLMVNSCSATLMIASPFQKCPVKEHQIPTG